MELCGGTHTRATGEIGLFRITGESAIAAGVRRIEGIAGLESYARAADEATLIKLLAGRLTTPVQELEKRVESLLAHSKEMERQLRSAQQREAAAQAKQLLSLASTIEGIPTLIARAGSADGETLQAMVDAIKGNFPGVILLAGVSEGTVALVAAVSSEFTSKVQAGKLIQAVAPIVGGKGGGRPDNARGGGKDASKIDEALAKARSLIGV